MVSMKERQSDIDVIYYDRTNIEKRKRNMKKRLRSCYRQFLGQLKTRHECMVPIIVPPYSSAVDAIGKFPETATALGVKLDDKNNLQLTAPHGINDFVNMVVKPTPFFKSQKNK